MAVDAPEASANWLQFMQKMRKGDDRATADLYAPLAAPLRLRLSRVVCPEEIEDSLQEVMVIVIEAVQRGGLRDPRRIAGFVSTVARRRMVSFIRGRISQRRRLADNIDTMPSLEQSPEDHAARCERVERLTKVLRRLRARDREILERFYLREQSRAEICGEMRLTETQFRLFKSRAIARCFDLAQARASSSRG